jgi:hypothetical protein
MTTISDVLLLRTGVLVIIPCLRRLLLYHQFELWQVIGSDLIQVNLSTWKNLLDAKVDVDKYYKQNHLS